MVTEELRKKWGTIFMGDREASLEQLDAMQEPILRERLRKEQEQNYMDRVKQRATERAKAILGEAYAERQKLLEEARAEAESFHDKLVEQAKQIQIQAQEEREQAVQELAKAREIRQEAELVKEQAHGEGYQAGLDQANEELKIFRGEMGQGFATILQLVDSQLTSITEGWREDLVTLVQTAVSAATGWVLDTRHEDILRALVVSAVAQLEQREVITVRVNPQDEELVADMFKAAREKAPEIKQWVVNADESIAPGGLVAESGSGSVDCRREYFNELVDGILTHLALPEGEEDIARALAMHEAASAQAQQFMPSPQSPEEAAPPAQEVSGMGDACAPESADVSQMAEEQDATLQEADMSPSGQAIPADPYEDSLQGQEQLDIPEEMSSQLPADDADSMPMDALDATTSQPPVMEELDIPDLPTDIPTPPADQLAVEEAEAMPVQGEVEDVPDAWLPPLGTADGNDLQGEASASGMEAENPSLMDLEEELFPLDESPNDKVLAQGGFLSGDTAQGR